MRSIREAKIERGKQRNMTVYRVTGARKPRIEQRLVADWAWQSKRHLLHSDGWRSSMIAALRAEIALCEAASHKCSREQVRYYNRIDQLEALSRLVADMKEKG